MILAEIITFFRPIFNLFNGFFYRRLFRQHIWHAHVLKSAAHPCAPSTVNVEIVCYILSD